MTRSCSNARAQRLIDEFTEAAVLDSGGFSVRHGIAAVLRHIADTEADNLNPERAHLCAYFIPEKRND